MTDAARVSETRPADRNDLRTHLIALTVVSAIALVGNAIGPDIPVGSAWLGVLLLAGIAAVGVLIKHVVPFQVPTILWISLVGILVSMPWSPGSEWVVEQVSQVDFLALATPILAYAGLGLARKELADFGRSGWKIVVVAILVFIGTYLGSALIAEVALNFT